MRDRNRFEREVAEVSPPPEPARPPSRGSPAKPTAAKTWSLKVVDGTGHALAHEPYFAYQAGASAHGKLVAGVADMRRIDPLQPFRFEVPGRACAIKEGAVLVADDGAVEYGGTVVDWSEADGPNADKTFWPQYQKYRTTPLDGPASFWQHEHLTRRPLKLRKSFAQAGKTAIIVATPVKIRVGPLVRFVNADSALIWVETRTPAMIRVRFDKRANARASPSDRYASTVKVGGRHYAIVELDKLAEDTRYDYTVEVASQQAAGGILVDQGGLQKAFPSLSADVLGKIKEQLKGASFAGNEWLTFRTLRKRYGGLRFAYGSCRKWPAGDNGGKPGKKKEQSGPDAFEDLQKFLANVDPDGAWPRFMILLGDQIYADDIGHKQGLAIARQRWGRRIPGPKTADGDGAWAGRFASRFSGVTKAPRNQKYVIDNHLLWHIPADAKNTHIGNLYPEPDPKTGKLPKGKEDDRPAGDTAVPPNAEVPPTGRSIPMHAADFAEYAFLYEAAWGGPGNPARKVLANIPTFMMFDDHEVTDDWNADRRWADNVHGPPPGAPTYWPETMADALAAYWMYQGWGNQSPLDWRDDQRSRLLLTHAKAGTDALPALRALLRRDLKPPVSLPWDFALPMESPIFYATDCRMRRVLRATKPAYDDQVLDRAGLDKMRALLLRSTAPVGFLIASSPILLPGLIAESFTYESVTVSLWPFELPLKKTVVDEKFRRKRDIEHWAANRSWGDVLRFLSDLSKEAPHLKTVVALSGDVHFSYNMIGRLDPALDLPKAMRLAPPRRDAKGRAFPYLLQLVSSGVKQELNDENAYAMRILVEDDSVIGAQKPPTPDMTDLRRMSRGFGISNRLWSPKFVREEYSFGGLQLRVGGFDNFDKRRALLIANSVALVDVQIDGKNTTFKLVERYVTRSGTPSYTFETTPSGYKQTVPRFS
jgi:hypothetical protein